MNPARKQLTTSAIACCFPVGLLGLAAFANAGGVIVPERASSNIEFDIQNAQTDLQPSMVLQVFVGDSAACCEGRTSIAGRYTVNEHRANEHRVTFDPAFDFVEGQNYTILFVEKNAGGDSTHHLMEFSIPPRVVASVAQVVGMYPGGNEIPENTLRFYIHFSTPMKPHLSSDFIKLIDAKGTQDTAAFMTFKQELWSHDRKRLTVLMDPGRIKRGVAQNIRLGPALSDGNSYSIVIEEGWPSASGLQELPRFEHFFSVTPALRVLPNTDLWQFKLPRAMTRDPLTIDFDRPFDHELLQNTLAVVDAEGQAIPGTVMIENYDNTWRFEPDSEWTDQTVQLVIDTRLEDVAGNNFRELLDHAVDSEAQSINAQTLTFKLRPAPG